MVASSILITGANRGLGLELVRQLASLTDAVRPKLIIAACRNPEAAADLRALSQKFAENPKISLIKLDVTDENSIQSAFAEASSLCGAAGLNLLINNAGVFPVKYTPEQFGFQSMMDCLKGNAVAPTILSKTFHPLLKTAAAQKDAGVVSTSKAGIVMMSSNLGSIANTQIARNYPYYAYNASKAALNMVMKCLSLEFAPDEILVSSLHPGWVATDMGGEQAPLTVEHSVKHMVATIAKMESGKFYNYDFAETGVYLPW